MSSKSIIIVVATLVVIGLIGGGIFLWYEARTAKGLTLEFEAPDRVSIGEPFILQVNVSNDSQSILNEVTLTIELPEGIAFVGSAEDKLFHTIHLGNVGIGSLTQEDLELVALQGENSIQEISALVAYQTTGLQSQFEKREETTIAVVGSSIALDITAPQKVFSGESFDIVILYTNTSEIDFEDVELSVTLPPSFTLLTASLEQAGESIWELGEVKAGSDGEVTLTGTIVGPDSAFFEFAARLGTTFLGTSYVIADQSGDLSIAASPLALNIELNKGNNSIPHLGDILKYTLQFTNNTDTGLKDIVVRARLIGEMFDLGTLTTNASLQAFNNTLIWNAANTSGLTLLAPGETRTVSFTARVTDEYPISQFGDKNFAIIVRGEVESPTVPFFVAADKTLTVAELTTNIGGEVRVDSQGYFRDAPSGILNNGPLPPTVGKATQYTIHWLVYNTSNDVTNVDIRAFLGSNVTFTGVVKSNAETEPTYNINTQEVRWQIPSVSAGKGIVSSPLEATFQVEVIPAINQVGSNLVLVKNVALSAHDEFTNETLFANDIMVTTSSLNDPTVSSQEGVVVP